jgi:hypothetical protein
MAALALLGAASSPRPVAPAQDVEQTLILIGDAGKPAPGGEPVFKALTRELGREPERTTVIFLGDNVYPDGLPAPDAPDRIEGERKLDAQVDVVRTARVRAIFIPGNHDWAQEKPAGWDAIRREAARVDGSGAPKVEMLPKGGCPGPVVEDVGPRLRLVFLDTQWWLHAYEKPQPPDSGCPQDTEDEVLAALNEALQTAGERRVVVAAHHPLASGGPHGGYFSFRQHLFPLTDRNKKLWIPLPVIGSLYPLSRIHGASPQDLANDRNRQMREALESVFRGHPPLVYAAGHEHALQVLDGASARHLLVSGAGIYNHESAVRKIEGTRFASSQAGFMKLEFEHGGRVRLSVLEVNGRGDAVESYAAWLTHGP